MTRTLNSPLTRRAFVTGSVAAAIASTFRQAAADEALVISQVDTLALHVIVDNATFGPFLPDLNLPGLRVERNTIKPAPQMSRHALMAEFGLSLLARSQVASESRSVLVDFGYTPEV